jgi:hypothetical protein
MPRLREEFDEVSQFDYSHACSRPARRCPALAQRQAAPQVVPPDLSAVPDKRPFNIPFGTLITMERAQGLIQTAVAEATKRGWALNVVVVDPNGDLIAFSRMERRTAGLDFDLSA